MSNASHDSALATVLLERLEQQRLPRALKLKERVDQGEVLAEYDLAFLAEVFADARDVMPLVDKNPQYHDLAARVLHLYKEITEKALENEQNRKA